MDITFDLSHLCRPGYSNAEKEKEQVRRVLNSALTRINKSYLRHHPQSKPLYREGVASTAAIPALFTFKLEHVFYPAASKVEESEVLRVLLDALIYIDVIYMRCHPRTETLYRAGVVYGRTEVWDPIPALYARGYGDCKSLSAALISQYLVRNVEALPVFRWNPRPITGIKDFHILVQTHRGFEDPSRKLGMGQDENAYFNH